MLAQKLERAGYAGEAVEAAIARAAERGYLDDQEYARSVVRRRSHGRGRAMIARELRARGIDEGAVEQALGEVDPGGEMERARVLAREIVRLKRPVDRAQLRTSVGGRLGRRGFSGGVITRVLRELSVDSLAPEFDTPPEPD
jgi:regulatory protein